MTGEVWRLEGPAIARTGRRSRDEQAANNLEKHDDGEHTPLYISTETADKCMLVQEIRKCRHRFFSQYASSVN